jgi:hypothetical protein
MAIVGWWVVVVERGRGVEQRRVCINSFFSLASNQMGQGEGALQYQGLQRERDGRLVWFPWVVLHEEGEREVEGGVDNAWVGSFCFQSLRILKCTRTCVGVVMTHKFFRMTRSVMCQFFRILE